MTQIPPPPKYRADIDGLRAIAVLAVLGFHAFPEWVQGGFIGVDVFFVLSGYLISKIIFENLDLDSFTFSDFYYRRIRRILPSLIVVLTACFIFGWFGLLADEFKQLGKHIAGGSGFISNLILWSESGYFDKSADTKPLLHLWSLGIEEQFYILWPLLIWLSWKRKFNLLIVIALTATISFVLNLITVKEDAIAAFYSPLTRFWELLSGSLLAWLTLYKGSVFFNLTSKCNDFFASIIHKEKSSLNSGIFENVISIFGLLILIYGLWKIDKNFSFPGKWALLPVIATIMLIAAGPHTWINRKILANKPMVWFGLVSFPLYLWHWPLLSFARVIENKVPSFGIRISASLLSILLAWLTYKIFERPIRSSHANEKTKVSILLFLMISIGCAGYYTYLHEGLEFRIAEFTKFSKAATDFEWPGKNLTSFSYEDKTLYRQNSNTKDITLFVGDSNITQYYPRVDELITSKPDSFNSAIFAGHGGCLPIPASPYSETHKVCINQMESALKFAITNPYIKNIVIGGQWNGYLSGGFGLNGNFAFRSKDYEDALARLGAYIKKLKDSGRKVYLILNIPIGTEIDPKYMTVRALKNFPNLLSIRGGGLPRETLEKSFGLIQNDLEMVGRLNGAILISPMDYLCNSTMCPSIDKNGEPIYMDNAHLRASYVRKNAYFIDETLVNSRK